MEEEINLSQYLYNKVKGILCGITLLSQVKTDTMDVLRSILVHGTVVFGGPSLEGWTPLGDYCTYGGRLGDFIFIQSAED